MNGCFTFALTVLTLRFCFYRAILCKFLVFLASAIRLHRKSTSTRVSRYLCFQFTSKILCVAVSKKFTGIRKYFAKDVRGNRFNVECKLCQFYNFINNKIFKISQKMARLVEKFLISNKFK